MERPFFSLSKRKRLTPINYVSPDGSVTVIVKPHQDYGMPTIWDADLLIWAASTLNDMKKRGLNDIPRRLTTKPYELLKAIGRDAGGSDCRHSCMTPPYVSATSPSRRTCARRPAKSRRTDATARPALHACPQSGRSARSPIAPGLRGWVAPPLRWATPS